MSSPAVPTFVVGQSVQNCGVGRLLQVQVKSCVNSQSRFMNLLCAVLPLQVPPDLFNKVWRQRVWIVMYLQPNRGILGCRTLYFADCPIRYHCFNDKIASPQGSFRIPDWGVVIWGLR